MLEPVDAIEEVAELLELAILQIRDIPIAMGYAIQVVHRLAYHAADIHAEPEIESADHQRYERDEQERECRGPRALPLYRGIPRELHVHLVLVQLKDLLRMPLDRGIHIAPVLIKPHGILPVLHDPHLVEGVPNLHRHGVETFQQVFVVQPAHGSGHRRQNDKPDPFVVGEPDTLLFTRYREHIERKDGRKYSDPLVEVEPLAKNEQRPQKGQYRLGGLYRSRQGDREMLHGKTSKSFTIQLLQKSNK